MLKMEDFEYSITTNLLFSLGKPVEPNSNAATDILYDLVIWLNGDDGVAKVVENSHSSLNYDLIKQLIRYIYGIPIKLN